MYKGLCARMEWVKRACYCKMFRSKRRLIWTTDVTSNGPCVGFQVSTQTRFPSDTFSGTSQARGARHADWKGCISCWTCKRRLGTGRPTLSASSEATQHQRLSTHRQDNYTTFVIDANKGKEKENFCRLL
jgi:hypothetical protein